MDVQVIRTPGGEELVVLERGHYEALVRRANLAPADAPDAVLAKRALASVGAGLDSQISEAVWAELEVRGSRLRILRSWRGMTQAQLTAEAGAAQPNISEAERAGAVGSRIGLD